MSDETATSPESASNSPAADAPRARRISNPRIKKPAKSAPTMESDDSPPPAESPKSPGFPDFSETSDDASTRGDWPEPDAASSGASSGQENPKRKRRRKKGKGGNGPQNATSPSDGDSPLQAPAEPSEQPTPQAHAPRQPHQTPRTKVDPELLAKFAWKIYLSEVSEEGVALVGDNDAKELSRRCFRLAEIFMEEQARRR